MIITERRYNMNEKIKEKIAKECKSLYQISKQTGIPYTTLSEIANEKVDVNKAAAETIWKLSLFFDCNMGDILNETKLIENSSGNYKGVKFRWENNAINKDVSDLVLVDDGTSFCICSERINAERFYKYYRKATEMMIDVYLEDKRILQGGNQ